MKIMKRNPSKSGYLCEVFSMNSQGYRNILTQFVIIAKSEAEAAAIVMKSIGTDPDYRFSLTYILIYS